MTTLVLQGAGLTTHSSEQIAEKLQADKQDFMGFSLVNTDVEVEALDILRDDYTFDINVLPEDFIPSGTRLLVMDMDSTLINIECVDEIADFVNVKPQVAAITESAMRGEIDFETSLRQRVSLLKGLEVSALTRVYEDRLQLNSGAEVMLKRLQQQGIKIALVSGGFTFFTERLKLRLGLDYTMANVLGEDNGRLTGEVEGDVCGAQAKADFLLAHCDKLNISPSQVVAMGDGANDLMMMNEAGLSVAYHAKPKVQKQAKTRLNYCGLEGVLGLLQLEFN
ncbi:MAG: phosphoserine phosphatase SerB [Gammaproteobacteria bacterium]|nr:MAG: phosphoserine phosphatase SerB [Gammaproteobacteria bacterium]RKZ97780.1 MAG: phosphoserine phosphatase SerB [Gammaproteobacteria bacterium]RLA00051.1 MAG: phosphoserine phosphatase SerB [Gammaproteobacteria bacterium]